MTQRALGALFAVVASACIATVGYRAPDSLRGYEILVGERDSLSTEVAAALRRHGFRVRRDVKGGGRPTVAAISFTFREPDPRARPWLYARFADTRTGVIVAAVTVSLDSVPAKARSLAEALVGAVEAQIAERRANPAP